MNWGDQRVLHVPQYDYGLDERARNFGLLEEAAIALADSHCQVVGQTGTNWVHCQGLTTPEDIETYCAKVSERIGVPFVMAGHCIVEALRHLGAERIAVSNGYYRDDWRDGINTYLTQAGFDIAASGHMRDQGIYTSLEEQIAAEDATVWAITRHLNLGTAVPHQGALMRQL
jgi:maleate cis-trans isomerase